MKKLLLFLTVLLATNCLVAQLRISGTVKDNKNRPVYGVSASVKDSYDGSTTDSTGHFSFRSTEKGEHVITATSIGYNSKRKILSRVIF